MLQLFSFSWIYIAIGAASYYLYYTELLQTSIDLKVLALIFFATILSYNAVQIFPIKFKSKTNIHPRQKWLLDHQKLILFLIALSFIIVLFLSFKLSWQELFVFGHLFFIVLLYEKTSDITYKKNGTIKELRAIPYFKSLLISYVWATSCTSAQIIEIFQLSQLNERALNEGQQVWGGLRHLYMWIESFLYILALTIPFDIRDFEHDKKEGLKTLVHLIGIHKAKILCFVLMALSFAITFSVQSVNVFSTIVVFGCYTLLLFNSKSGQHDYYYFYGFDSLIILKLLLLI